ncbi:MAG TPA: flagellar biosynthetic protein FliR [Enterovirga sp.]|jgi:flagellar biosynthetic protein FliR|nr:flagellar biosynthetic protein FliR [Enterovirga sp.]
MTLAIPDLAALFMLTFARVGTLVMLLPAIGERMVPGNIRLGFALLLSLALFPLTRTILPPIGAPAATIGILIGEIAVGLVLGLATRMVVAALQTAGTIVSQQLGLSFAMTIDPSFGGQDAAMGNFLNLLGLTLIFATDLHHLALAAIRDSYTMLPPVGVPETGDVAKLAIGALARGFALAVQISAPFIVFAMLFNLGLGVLSRLMPQMQVFFIGLPVTIIVGMLVLVAALGLMMNLYLEDLGRFLTGFGAR